MKDNESKKGKMVEKASAGITRRCFMERSALLAAGWVGTMTGGWVLRPTWANAAGPIKIGILQALSGMVSGEGVSSWQAAQVWAKRKNDRGGILGRSIELIVEDTASDPSKALPAARRLTQQKNVDVVIGPVLSSSRDAVKRQITVRDKKLYIYPTLYEGGECTPYVFCSGIVPNHQSGILSKYITDKGLKRAALVGQDYVWPRKSNEIIRRDFEKAGIEVVIEEYFPMDAVDYAALISKMVREKVDIISNFIINGMVPFCNGVIESGFYKEGGMMYINWADELIYSYVPSKYLPDCISVLDTYQSMNLPQDKAFTDAYYSMFPETKLSPGTATNTNWRALEMLEQAIVRTNGDLSRDALAEALPGCKSEECPGGPVEVVNNHCKMNMYLGINRGEYFEMLDSAKMVDPKECV